MRVWQDLLLANDFAAWLLAATIGGGVLAVLALVKYAGARVLGAIARRTEAGWDNAAAEALRATSVFLGVVFALYAGATALTVPARLGELLSIVAVLALLLQVALWANRFIVSWFAVQIPRRRAVDPEGATAYNLLGVGARIFVWSLILLVALDHLGFNITGLVAGLGIGGIAVALAVQNILGDLFASLSIVLDKPFVVGDFIVVDSLRGTVERVGIKTTHVRSLDGEMLVFSNADLLKSRIRNFKRMLERRVLFRIGVIYQTPAEKVKSIPQWLREAVEAQQNARFDRAHFLEYGDSALVFEIVYYVRSPDYNVYMDTQQAINLAILDRFAREGVEFAYPTRTLHISSMVQAAGATA
ncbi:MAG: mechanosensitive ion channel family protein [Candidatus Rokubacteria bacterium]|nr:mechanosensitive ion channel family protein [Betaproteobacteria bacterium]MBM4441079.1 mechanosensitive ion channel family protein [Candidatus Rokubacteria bacterium]